MPSQNTGIAMPSWDTPLSSAPYQVCRLWAAVNPAGTAISTARTKAARVSGTVTSIRAATSGPTGSELTKEVPRSPLASCPIQWVNCSGSGRSEPMA